MDISRPIASIVPLPPKRDDSNASFHSRNNAASRRDPDRVEAERDLATERQQSRPNPETAQNSNTAPIQFRDIQPTFISSREMKVIEHFPYSAQFLTQQLAQQEDGIASPDPVRAHSRAASAYDNSLSLTATVLGFEGRAERLA